MRPGMGAVTGLLVGLLCTAGGCSDDDNPPAADQGAAADQALIDATAGEAAITPDTGQADTTTPQDAAPDVALDAAAQDSGGTGKDFGITCNATVGTAQVSGTVNGKAVTATHAGAVGANLAGLMGYGVALLDKGGTCANLSGIIGAPKLWILLCSDTVGTHTIGTNCLGDAGGISFQNQASIPMPGGGDPKATSGTVTITSFDASCGGTVKGSFSLDFSGQKVTGSFDTVGCGTISL